MIKILVVEDDVEIQRSLCTFLTETGYEVVSAMDGLEAITLFDDSFHLVLLDLMLPKIDGFAVCGRIRSKSVIPIIMLTALSGEQEQMRGFDLKIDDYITKPFTVSILLRKIEAVLRRTMKDEFADYIVYEDLKIDLVGMNVLIQDKPIDLTAKEYQIVLEMFSHQGIVITRDILLTKLWGFEAFYDDRVINTHMRNIRKKLGVDYIGTVRGVGYKVEKLHQR